MRRMSPDNPRRSVASVKIRGWTLQFEFNFLLFLSLRFLEYLRGCNRQSYNPPVSVPDNTIR
jgi:hypothetical protein